MNNTVPPGYKQTEVGVIPEEWEVKPFIEVTNALTCGVAATPKYVDNSIGKPFLSALNVKDGQVVADQYRCISEELFDQLTKINKPEVGDILYTRVGAGIGEAGVNELDFDFAVYVSLTLIKPKKFLDSYFLKFLLNSHYYQQLAKRDQFAGGGVQNLNVQVVREFPIPLPPLPEQRAIAAALSDVDALIASLDTLITKKRDMKQAAMQELLTGKRRLPGFSGEWEMKRLGEIGSCLRGVTYKGDSDLSPHDTAHTRRLLRSNNVQDSIVTIKDVQFVNAVRVLESQLLREDDILICMANGSKALVGKAGLFSISDGYDYTFGAFMGCYRTSSDGFNPTFVFYLFQTGRYRDYINILLAGSSINNLNPSSIESLEFFVPLVRQAKPG